MKTLKNLLFGIGISGIIGCGIVLSGCKNKDNQKYKDFANFIIKEGEKDINGEFLLGFSKGNKRYYCTFYNEKHLRTDIFIGRSEELFEDRNLNGLDNYEFIFDGVTINENISSSKEEYERLIDSIPKWYAESKHLSN